MLGHHVYFTSDCCFPLWHTHRFVHSFHLIFFVLLSTPSCWPWSWRPSSSTSCTPLTFRVRTPGTTRPSTCSTPSSSQVLQLVCVYDWLNMASTTTMTMYVSHGVLSPGFIKVILYIAFMTIMIKVHTFPLFAIRPMYLAMRWAALLMKCLSRTGVSKVWLRGPLWPVEQFYVAHCSSKMQDWHKWGPLVDTLKKFLFF